jgi:hypothetical protein
MHEQSNEISPTPNECVRDPLNGVMSFRIPLIIKGPKESHFKNVLEKTLVKKRKKGAYKKGTHLFNAFCSSVKFIPNICLSYILQCR